jgi:hypothetical protein
LSAFGWRSFYGGGDRFVEGGQRSSDVAIPQRLPNPITPINPINPISPVGLYNLTGGHGLIRQLSGAIAQIWRYGEFLPGGGKALQHR